MRGSYCLILLSSCLLGVSALPLILCLSSHPSCLLLWRSLFLHVGVRGKQLEEASVSISGASGV